MSTMMDLSGFDVDMLSTMEEGVIPVAAGGTGTLSEEAAAKKARAKTDIGSVRKRARQDPSPAATTAMGLAAAEEQQRLRMISQADPLVPTRMVGMVQHSSSLLGYTEMARIGWLPSQGVALCKVLDESMAELPPLAFEADVDKGFKPSPQHKAFICQKKNHFQVTVSARFTNQPRYIATASGVLHIKNLELRLYGIKIDSPADVIPLEQSVQNRTKKPFSSKVIEIGPKGGDYRATVGRLHFTETTSNNMRKRGKPNPDQRYFALVCTVVAVVDDGSVYPLASLTSDKIIVRASNPGQFETEVSTMWTRSADGEGIHFNGNVGIKNVNPDEALCINGNLAMTGTLMQPSDRRVKTNFEECDGAEQLSNVRRLSLYRYDLRPEWASSVGLDEADAQGHTGVLAQELATVLPDAVKVTGDRVLDSGETIEALLVVNKDRLLMEGLGALKHLAALQDETAARVARVEARNKELRAAVAAARRRPVFGLLPTVSPIEAYLRVASILFSR